MNKYIYNKLQGYLAVINEIKEVKPIASINGIGFYSANDIKLNEDISQMCYDDYLGGGYCGGEIEIAEVEDIENKNQKIITWVSKEYIKNVKHIDI